MGVGNDDAYTFCIYEWRSGVVIMKGSSGRSKIYQLVCTDAGFASCGDKEVKVGSSHVLCS